MLVKPVLGCGLQNAFLFLGGTDIEDKLVIEVPFKDGEKEWFLRFAEHEALDIGMYVRKLIMDARNKRKLEERRVAATAKRPAKKEGTA